MVRPRSVIGFTAATVMLFVTAVAMQKESLGSRPSDAFGTVPSPYGRSLG